MDEKEKGNVATAAAAALAAAAVKAKVRLCDYIDEMVDMIYIDERSLTYVSYMISTEDNTSVKWLM